jgi:pantetheine-phosphate adenylyltransferase
VAFAQRVGAQVIVKGLRSVEDVHHELRQAVMNRHLSGLDTLFFMPSPAYAQISSTLIREVARLGGDISAFVPPAVARRMAADRHRRRGRGRR